jgi:hypothetical protein
MAVDGKYSITIQSPMGAQPADLELKADGGTLTGTQSSRQGSMAIANGKTEGDNVSWSIAITSPMPMTLEFSGKVDGDAIAGTVKAGAFGSFPFSGKRA